MGSVLWDQCCGAVLCIGVGTVGSVLCIGVQCSAVGSALWAQCCGAQCCALGAELWGRRCVCVGGGGSRRILMTTAPLPIKCGGGWGAVSPSHSDDVTTPSNTAPPPYPGRWCPAAR